MRGINKLGFPARPIAKTRAFTQTEPMPADDRGEALGWFCRRMIIQERERGKTQREIGEKVGLTQATISNIENAVTLPAITTAIALAEYFKRTPGELLDEALDWWSNRGGREEAIRTTKEAQQKRFGGPPPKPPLPPKTKREKSA